MHADLIFFILLRTPQVIYPSFSGQKAQSGSILTGFMDVEADLRDPAWGTCRMLESG